MPRPIFIISAMIIALALFSCAGIVTPSHHAPEQYSDAFAAASAGDTTRLGHDLSKDPSLIRQTEWDGRTLLHDAVDKSRLETAQYLLDHGADVDATTADGRTALHMAAQRGDVPMITLLLSRGAAIDERDANGWTPLYRAEKWGRGAAAEVLRSRGGHT